VEKGSIVLAGSAIGRIAPKSRRIVGDVREGDAVVLLASSGVHTNGLTLCRTMAEGLERGYLTPMSDGRSFGEGLLDASVIYVKFVKACQEAGIALHYAAHITGHGWRKLMRLEEPFVYTMHDLGRRPAVFDFIQRTGGVDEREMYATFNMGAGFGVYLEKGLADTCVRLAGKLGYTAWVAGSVGKQGNRKAVEIVPLGITFEGESLQVR
jgi:phosphoribosylformylglycinamidine cyclo-ligase